MSDPLVTMLDWLAKQSRQNALLAKEARSDGKEDVAAYHSAKAFAFHQAEDRLRFILALEERA